MNTKQSKKVKKNIPYNWVAHSLEDENFRQRIVKQTKGIYNRRKEKQVNFSEED